MREAIRGVARQLFRTVASEFWSHFCPIIRKVLARQPSSWLSKCLLMLSLASSARGKKKFAEDILSPLASVFPMCLPKSSKQCKTQEQPQVDGAITKQGEGEGRERGKEERKG